ncbi:hypothetical protein FYK55_11050 [Roseiconus nitratireducens]|uniref:Dockerin domain-containing protein n=1 Tax=Roseiconus nitratireducens TaxID=2605748 RepID=A0A5M6DBE4_9BACT|nr:dockerin type I domain-containing protein [Roseiconus nitratireducens]KAA5543720.1 hypothetical protein FYK55_11050 [Roseiconus nitratireducens]
MRRRFRSPRFQALEGRRLLAASLHNAEAPADVNRDGSVTQIDALWVVNYLSRQSTHGKSGLAAEGASLEGSGAAPPVAAAPDVNGDLNVSAIDALMVINHLARDLEAELPPPPPIDFDAIAKAPGVGTTFTAGFNLNESGGSENLLAANEVETLLSRASMATASDDAIIAIVDRSGRILGVRVEDGVSPAVTSDAETLAFAIDGAVAKARTAAFFSSNAAPLTSRTVRFISQSTVTQREVESSPTDADPAYRGPGFVAPIGVGGHFPPEVDYTPQVDLFAIEHQSRDSRRHAGADGTKGTADDFFLNTRFNADPAFIPEAAETFFTTWPESYGEQSGTSTTSVARGIGTLPGGVPLYKAVPGASKPSESINLVGGIGVFFPGDDGFATFEQGFQHTDDNGGVTQSEKQRTNAAKVLEAEAAAVIAAAGGGMVGPNAFVRNLNEFNRQLPELEQFVLPTGRIDLVGITLEIYGPTPDRSFRQPGIDRVIHEARKVGTGIDSGVNVAVLPDATTLLDGNPVPEGWLVAPHDSPNGELTAAEVQQMIETGIAEAERTRAAIRLDIDNGFRPGATTRMVLAVSDTDGELLGLYRMPDATVFSIDVSVAKSRNTAYYADPDDLVEADRVDFNGDGLRDDSAISMSLKDDSGDTFPLGTALTSRSFRFLVEPRFPTGIKLSGGINDGLTNDPLVSLCDAKPTLCVEVGPQSGLRLPGIDPLTAENLDSQQPLDFQVYASAGHPSTVMFDAFIASRNFRDPGDANVQIAGGGGNQPLANQNGVVFFPGSTAIYVDQRSRLAGGLGVSGDGVDQDDVVTSAGQIGFSPLQSTRVDRFTIGGVRVPFQKFNRNPFGT